MNYHPRVAEAVRLAHLGNFDQAILVIQGFLADPSLADSTLEMDRAKLYLGSFHRFKGEGDLAISVLESLTADEEVDRTIRALTWIELATVRSHVQGDYPTAFHCMQQAEPLIDFRTEPGSSRDQDLLLGNYHMVLGCLYYRTGRAEGALLQYERARDFYLSRGLLLLVNCYLNLANVHALLGRKDQAREQITLAWAAQRQFGGENAYGLVHLFEVLATHNLFVYGSEQKSVDCLMQISEEVVKGFADYRRVFDFFSEILVEIHQNQFDLDKLRAVVAEYGDDPLVRKFLPSLITGAPAGGEEKPPVPRLEAGDVGSR